MLGKWNSCNLIEINRISEVLTELVGTARTPAMLVIGIVEMHPIEADGLHAVGDDTRQVMRVIRRIQAGRRPVIRIAEELHSPLPVPGHPGLPVFNLRSQRLIIQAACLSITPHFHTPLMSIANKLGQLRPSLLLDLPAKTLEKFRDQDGGPELDGLVNHFMAKLPSLPLWQPSPLSKKRRARLAHPPVMPHRLPASPEPAAGTLRFPLLADYFSFLAHGV